MTNPHDRDDPATSASDPTAVTPNLKKEAAAPDLEKTTVVGETAMKATAPEPSSPDSPTPAAPAPDPSAPDPSAPDPSAQAPYYESEWSPAYAQTEIQQTPNLQKSVDQQTPQAQFGGTPQPGYGDLAPQPNYGEQIPMQYPTQEPYGGYGTPSYGAPQGYAPGYGQPGVYPGGAPGAYPNAQSLPPVSSTTSAILATVFGGLLIAGCYTSLIGIAPLVLGIMSLNKSNSVSRLWYLGQQQAAHDAVASASNLAKWAWISMAIGFAVVVVAVVVIIAIVAGTSV